MLYGDFAVESLKGNERAIIFFDIDGTLCRYEDTVNYNIKKCFKRLHKGNHVVFLCTGRSPKDISNDILSLGFDGIIACMGAVIIHGNEVLQNKFITPDMLLETVGLMIERKVPALILGIDEVLRTEQMKPTPLETGIVRSVEDLYMNGKLVEISSLDIEYPSVSALGPIREMIDRHSNLIEYNETSGQTRLKGVNKAEAIRVVLARYSHENLKSYAIGDSQNDIEMLNCVDVGIAMGDAPEDVKSVASWITSTVEEDGVCNAMKHFGLG